MEGQPDGNRHRAERGCGAQEAEAARPGVQDVACKDGHEGNSATEQDNEEVKRDGAEEKLGSPHVTEACEDRIDGCGFMLCAAGADAELANEDEKADERKERKQEDDGCAGEAAKADHGERQCEEQAAHGGTGNVGELEDGGAPGDGVYEMFLGDELREPWRCWPVH